MAERRPDGCTYRVATGGASSFAAGSLAGAATANWGDVPVVLRDKPGPALKRTGRIMMQYGATFGFVGLAFTGVDCFAETVRDKHDMWNGVLGGLAAGTVLGLRIGKLPVGVGAAVSLALTSALVDISGQKWKGQQFNDNLTPPRRIYPYPSENVTGYDNE